MPTRGTLCATTPDFTQDRFHCWSAICLHPGLATKYRKSFPISGLTCESRLTDTNIARGSQGSAVAEGGRQPRHARVQLLWGQLRTVSSLLAGVTIAFIYVGLTLGTLVACRIKVQRSCWVRALGLSGAGLKGGGPLCWHQLTSCLPSDSLRGKLLRGYTEINSTTATE